MPSPGGRGGGHLRIEEVRLRNFRSYGNNTTTLGFRPGLNVLLGRIGSGKSSILETVLICLFGFSRSGIRKNDVLRRDVTADNLQMELTFLFEGMHFKVLRGNETRMETSPDGMSWTLVSENSNEINEYIESTLQVSARKFRDLFYAAQGELTNVITGSPEERQKSIDKLLGAEGLRETYERLTEFTKYYDKDIGSAEGEMAHIDAYLERHDLDEMRDGKRAEEKEVIAIGERIEALAKEIGSLQDRLGHLVSKATPLEELNSRLQRMQSRIAEKESELKNKEFQVGEIEKRLANLADQIKAGRARLKKLGPERSKIEDAIKQKEALRERMEVLRTKATNLVEQQSRMSKDIRSLREELDEERERQLAIKSELKASESRLAQLSTEREEQERGIATHKEVMEERTSHVPDREKALRDAELKLNTIQAKARENAERITRLNALSEGAQCPFCEQPISRTHRATVIKRIERLIRKLLTDEEGAKSIADRARKSLEDLRSEIQTATIRLQELGEALARTNEAAAREDQSRSNLEENLKESVSRTNRSEEELKGQESRLEDLSSQLRKMKEESGLVEKDWLETLGSSTENLQREIREAQQRLTQIDGDVKSAEGLLQLAEKETTDKQATLGELKDSVAGLTQELSEKKVEIASIYEPLIGRTDDPLAKLSEMIAEIQAEIQKTREDLKEREISKVSLSAQYKQREDRIAQLARQIEEYMGEEKKREKLKRTLTIYSEAKNVLQQIRDKYKDAREMIRTNLINVLRETLRVEFDRLYAYEDFHDVKVSDNYEVSLESPVGEIQAHNLSAGQKAIVSIAFRLAVAKAMEMKIGCWIIDEPTQNIGKAEVEALAEVLADTTEIPQIVVASHHEALGRHGNVISLGVRNGETILGEGGRPLAVGLSEGQAPTETAK